METRSQGRIDPSIKKGTDSLLLTKRITFREVIKVLSDPQKDFVLFMQISPAEKDELILRLHERLQAVYGESKEAVVGGWTLDHTKRLLKISHGKVSTAIKRAKERRKDGNPHN